MKAKSVDVFIQSATLPKFDTLAGWKCTDVFNRGTRVGPEGKISCHMTDVYQCRFANDQGEVDGKEVAGFLQKLSDGGLVWSEVHMIWAGL